MGHTVEALSPTTMGLVGLTRHVRKLHRVPRFGEDLDGWLEATLGVLRGERYDVLLATHEQVALLSRETAAVTETGVALAVPPFEALRRVQDKVSQVETLAELGLPQPSWRIFSSTTQLFEETTLPVYLKSPIGTASNTVCFIDDMASLDRTAREFAAAGALEDGGLLAQEPLPGPILMVQAVFDRGRLAAWHANLRLREGPNGGSSLKASIAPEGVEQHLVALGATYSWHGALSLDAVLTEDGPRYIDINPRLVEPGNAWRAGVDLVQALIAVSLGDHVEPSATPREDVRTHQLLLAVLAAAEDGRRSVTREVFCAFLRRAPYDQSTEELTPRGGDALWWLPVTAATTATLVWPQSRHWFTDGAVAAYALTPAAWRQITTTVEETSA